MGRRWMGLLFIAASIRIAAILCSDRVVADVQRYERVAHHLREVSLNPYRAARLYPYPPIWMAVESAALWLSERTPIAFAIWIKLPILCADLAIVWCLARWSADWAGASAAPLLYAVHPVSVLVSGFHGQFDALPLLGTLVAARALLRGREVTGALALSAAIALKSFPVLLLPLFISLVPRGRRARFLTWSLVPVIAILLPFVWDDPGAVRRELFAYAGVADFGWIGLWRGLLWWRSGVLVRASADNWGTLIVASKLVFVAAYAVLALRFARAPSRAGLPKAILSVWLAFLACYGSLSAQYLLWPLPFGVLWRTRALLAYSTAATIGLVGFYLFLAPGVLMQRQMVSAAVRDASGGLWLIGVALVWVASLFWLVSIARRMRA